ncbi:unnamed protein product [Paramecium sonneborni]|uniref:Transmembrane protein n=1 Tax=Paramecium sonneborni TaxID=65129 RepID=A0A8S1RSJ6_9CILI|nr:unnamed protein product [Paramecium sonneborni]
MFLFILLREFQINLVIFKLLFQLFLFNCVILRNKANRIYCHECLRLGDHTAHPNDQYDLRKLLQFIEQIRQQSDELIEKLTSSIETINQSFSILSQGLKTKYQLSEEQIKRFDAKQLNQALDQLLKYNETTKGILLDVEKCSNETFIQFNRISSEFKLNQLIYYDQIEQQKCQASDLDILCQTHQQLLLTFKQSQCLSII